MYHLLSGLYSQLTQKRRCNVLVLGIERSGKTAWLDCVRAAVTKTKARSLSRFVPTVGQNVLNVDATTAVLHFWDLGGDASLRRLWARYYDDAEVLVWVMDARDWIEAAGLSAGSVQDSADAGEDDLDAEDERGRRREDAWDTLHSMSRDAHLASLPLLIVMTHLDCIESSHVTAFRNAIHDTLRTRLHSLATPLTEAKDTLEDEERLREELKRIDDSISGARHGRKAQQPWQDWTVLCTSAKSGVGVDGFIDWLKQRAIAKVP